MSVATMRAVELPSGETLPVLGLGTWHLGEGRHPPQVEIDAAFPPRARPVPLEVL